MEKKGKPNLHIVPPDPFEDPIPWLERAARKFEEEDQKANQEKRLIEIEIEPAQDIE
jgi:hypothetical protein